MTRARRSGLEMSLPVASVVVDAERWQSEIVRRLVDAAQPSAIWLFGSRARGDHRPDSDVDVLGVLSGVTPANRRESAIRLHAALGTVPVPVDIIVHSLEEFVAERDARGTNALEAAHDGWTIYAA